MVLLTRRKRIVNDLDAVTFELDSAVDDRFRARFGRDPYRDNWFFNPMAELLDVEFNYLAYQDTVRRTLTRPTKRPSA